MKISTELCKVNKNKPAHDVMARAAGVLKNGGLVIFPTDTVYGIAASAFHPDARKAIYHLKGRAFSKPLIIMPPDIEALKVFAEVPERACAIVKEFWPGPLTLVLPTTAMGKLVMGGRPDVGARIPDSPVALALLKTCGFPLMTTSANLSEKPSAICAQEVIEDFTGKVDMIIDGGTCRHSRESTVIDATHFHFVVIREGCLPSKKLLDFL
jgi:L-threonylcarbamoyladenylate synthase